MGNNQKAINGGRGRRHRALQWLCQSANTTATASPCGLNAAKACQRGAHHPDTHLGMWGTLCYVSFTWPRDSSHFSLCFSGVKVPALPSSSPGRQTYSTHHWSQQILCEQGSVQVFWGFFVCFLLLQTGGRPGVRLSSTEVGTHAPKGVDCKYLLKCLDCV